MLYDILPIILILLSLGAVVFILMKKMSQVSMIDIKKIPREVQSDVKKDLIEKKIDRKLVGLGEKFRPLGDLVGGFWDRYFKGFKKRVAALEGKYKHEDKESVKGEPEVLEKDVFSLFKQAELLVSKGKMVEAEKKYLEVISLDDRNIVAYAGLAGIYYKSKELAGAKEAMEYVFKLADSGYGEIEAADLVLLVLIYMGLKKYDKAFLRMREAIKMEPNSPKNLDLLCKISIISKNKKEASLACEALARVNPGNKRIVEYRREVKKL